MIINPRFTDKEVWVGRLTTLPRLTVLDRFLIQIPTVTGSKLGAPILPQFLFKMRSQHLLRFKFSPFSQVNSLRAVVLQVGSSGQMHQGHMVTC